MLTKTDASLQAYWESIYQVLYQTCYHETLAESLISRWQRVDFVATLVVAATASGSALAGWSLWNKPGWKAGWAILAACASLISIAQSTLGTPKRLKDLEDLRRHFSQLHVEIDSFLQKLKIGLNANKAELQLSRLQEKLAENIGRASGDLILTERLRNRVQDRVNERLKLKEGD